MPEEMRLLTLVSSLVWLVQFRGGRHPVSGIGAGRVPSRWLPGGTDQCGQRSGSSHSSAWHGCRECPLGCGTFGLASPGTCSGKEPNVHFLM